MWDEGGIRCERVEYKGEQVEGGNSNYCLYIT